MTHQVLVKKFNTAMNILKSDAEYVVTDKAPETELEFNEACAQVERIALIRLKDILS